MSQKIVALETCMQSSLEKIFADQEPTSKGREISLCAFRGETVSFQIAYRLNMDAAYSACTAFGKLQVCVSVVSMNGEDGINRSVDPEEADIRIRQVLPVMCRKSRYQSSYDEDYLFKEECMAPDLLRDIGADGVPVTAGDWQSLWVDVCPGEKAAGKYRLTVKLVVNVCPEEANQEPVSLEDVCNVDFQAIPKKLPALGLPHTEWFHCDAIVDYYGVPAFSEEFWRIFERFIEIYVKRGGNTILVPVITPPLDTEVGMERTTIQLVEVVRLEEKYELDFSRLEQFLDICLKKGITYFEICHLFTQWGAEAAPKVMAWVDGSRKRIFGWETPSDDPEYLRFLETLLPALKEVLRKRGLLNQTFFHISDEPNLGSVHYQTAQKEVRRLLAGCTIIEAVSDYQYCEKGLVDIPICATNHIEPFLGKRPNKLWTYYCCAQDRDVPNRFIALPSWRNRIYGVLLYWHQIDGFLHWGFNYYNSERSKTHIDPYETVDGDGSYPAGDPFLVYPGPEGVPEESIRIMVQEEAINDYRALCLLETYSSREQVMALIREEAGMELTFKQYPRTADFLIRLRERINGLLA